MSVHPDPVSAGGPLNGLAELFQAHADWLRRAVRRKFGDAVSPEDIVQEAYLRAPRNEDVRHPRAFLLQVASRLALDQLRRDRRAALHVETHEVGGCEPSVQAETILLQQLLKGLPETCRQTFILNRFGGLSYEEIAARQGVSVKTVEWRISKALAYCTAHLKA